MRENAAPASHGGPFSREPDRFVESVMPETLRPPEVRIDDDAVRRGHLGLRHPGIKTPRIPDLATPLLRAMDVAGKNQTAGGIVRSCGGDLVVAKHPVGSDRNAGAVGRRMAEKDHRSDGGIGDRPEPRGTNEPHSHEILGSTINRRPCRPGGAEPAAVGSARRLESARIPEVVVARAKEELAGKLPQPRLHPFHLGLKTYAVWKNVQEIAGETARIIVACLLRQPVEPFPSKMKVADV